MRGNNGEGVEHQLNYLHLCPVCLRKLHWNIGFDIPTRYARLLNIFQEYETTHPDFTRDCAFLQQRLKELESIQPETTIISDILPRKRKPDVAQSQFSGLRTRSKSPAGAVSEQSASKAPSKAANPLHTQADYQPPVDPRSTSSRILAKYPAHPRPGLPRPGPGSVAGSDTGDASGPSRPSSARRQRPPAAASSAASNPSRAASAGPGSRAVAQMSRISTQNKSGNLMSQTPFIPAAKQALSKNGSSALSALLKTGNGGLKGSACACCATELSSDEEMVCSVCE